MDNAIKHSPAGSSVQITLVRTDNRYQIDVVDHGIGIPLSAQPHIFDRFYRVDISRARSNPSPAEVPENRVASDSAYNRADSVERIFSTSGAGLGLAISRWIAEAHGGSVELWYSTSIGSNFRISLPASDAV